VGRVVLDTSVVIAILNAEDAHHDAAVAAVRAWTPEQRAVPLLAFAEALVGAHRAGTTAVRAVEGFATRAARLVALTDTAARAGAALRARRTALSLADALIIATAEELHADAVLTADNRWRRSSRLVRVI
jgi:predicted nucleic acid-binding protein